jgi:hypothetical protein
MTKTFILPRVLPRDIAICNIVEHLEDLSIEQGWRVEIVEHKARRSDQQNRYLWGVVYPAIMARLDGWEADDVHEYCLGEWSGWETVVGLGKKRLRPIRRSSKLSKLEFMEYVEFIQRRMAEHGIDIPDPDPDMRQEEAA